MKNLLLLFAVVAFCATASYGQFRVTADGVNHALNAQLIVGEEAGAGAAFIDVGGLRTAAGSAQIRFFDDASGAVKFNFQRLANGASVLRHVGTNIFGFTAQNAADMVFRTNNQIRMRITSGGAVAITGGATVNGGMVVTSDKRLKSNINSLEYGLNEVLQLNPVSYNYTGENSTPTDRAYVGLVAQELNKVMPEFVSTQQFIDYADDGTVIKDEEHLAIHDTELKYVLINAIQEQQELIEAQAEKIAELQEAFSTIGSTESNNRTNVTLSGYDLAELDQNAPNPFNGTTNISYIIPTDASTAQISVFSQNGQLMKTLDIEHVGQGTLTVNAQDLPAGTYSYQLVVDGRNIQTNKMVVQ